VRSAVEKERARWQRRLAQRYAVGIEQCRIPERYMGGKCRELRRCGDVWKVKRK